jgi:hypothetical protein
MHSFLTLELKKCGKPAKVEDSENQVELKPQEEHKDIYGFYSL